MTEKKSCNVCGGKIEVNNGRFVEHQLGSKICYGSFTPVSNVNPFGQRHRLERWQDPGLDLPEPIMEDVVYDDENFLAELRKL